MDLNKFCENIRSQTGEMPQVTDTTVSISGVIVANIVDGNCIPVPMKTLVNEPMIASVMWAATKM